MYLQHSVVVFLFLHLSQFIKEPNRLNHWAITAFTMYTYQEMNADHMGKKKTGDPDS